MGGSVDSFANKQDFLNAMTAAQVTRVFWACTVVRHREWFILTACATCGRRAP